MGASIETFSKLKPMSRFPRLRRVLHWAMAGLLGVQFGTIAGLTVIGSRRKKKRKPYRFPTASAVPIPAGEDEVTIYTFGRDLYADMLEAIRGARETIYFETYIWKSDHTGRKFRQALIEAAERGVRVYVIFDDFANLVVKRSFLRLPPALHVYRHPAYSVPWNPKRWGRDHRKILVVDDTAAFVGGYNIGSLYAHHWRDTHVRITGPAVSELQNAFADFWNMHRRTPQPELEPPRRRPWAGPIRVQRNVPRLQVYPIRNMYLEAIDRACERVWLTHAYLIPDDEFLGVLFAAVRRGVDVRIIVPAESNHVVADWLSRGYYTQLLRYGVRLFLYQGAMVHAKTATIDGQWSTIGTANLDRLSLWGNYEVNLEITDPAVARRMEEIFALDEGNSIELTLDQWTRRSVVAKATEAILSPWRPLL